MERVGLLFVHGIGEQQRFEHLSDSVRAFAELIKSAGPFRVSVVDRTQHWKRVPGDPEFGVTAQAPMTLSVRGENHDRDFECHEVWWSDLDHRDSISETLSFWWWGLGQWSAPIFRELDPTGASPTNDGARRDGGEKPADHVVPAPSDEVAAITAMPRSATSDFRAEAGVRARLALAGLCAILTAVSWSLVKKLFAVLAKAPSPTLIFQYVGDVRVYERRATPNKSAPGDPGQPPRVAIRRRMVSEMVAMASRDYDGWYVCAHSLGSVLAYNGLTEIGHALPNYLSEESWSAVPAQFKRDAGVALRPRREVHKMMPARPGWLEHGDVINRPRLFARLRGFLTYGSPLDKFAAIWPRIVATATDRTDGRNPFRPACAWVNLSTANDPVSGVLDSYGDPALAAVLPELINVAAPLDRLPGLAHIRYFLSAERDVRGRRVRQRLAIMRWLFGGQAAKIPGRVPPEDADEAAQEARRALTQPGNGWAIAQFLGVVFGLVLLTGLFALLAGSALSWLGFGAVKRHESFNDLWPFVTPLDFAITYRDRLLQAIGLALTILTLAGLTRWWSEARLNARLAKSDGEDELTQRYLRAQRDRSAAWLAAIAPLAMALAFDFGLIASERFADAPPAASLLVALPTLLLALWSQAALNRRFTGPTPTT